MREQLFPKPAIAILRQARWDPNATRSFEIMSGGFAWSDEGLKDAAFLCMEHGSWAFRYIMGYRASLIRDTPREKLRAAWDQLIRACPEWPGFRSERVSPALAGELEQESRRTCKELRRLERKLNKHGGQAGPTDGTA